MSADTNWKCSACGTTNEVEMVRCTCGYELPLNDAEEEVTPFIRYQTEQTLAENPAAFSYKSGHELRDLFISAFIVIIGLLLTGGLFESFFGHISDEVGLALQSLIFSIAAIILNQKYFLNFRPEHISKIMKYALIGITVCMLRFLPYFIRLAEERIIPKEYEAYAILPPFKGAVLLLFAVIVLPALEEILFRGFLFRLLIKRYGMFTAFATSSLAFSAYHGFQSGWVGSHLLFALVACYVYNRSQSIWTSILTHTANNAIWYLGTGLLIR